MTSLDLSQRPPHPCRAELDGVMFLPRAIDKARATLPGGDLGSYIVTPDGMRSLSGLFFRRLGFTREEFDAAVSAASAETDVAAWLRNRVEQQRIDDWNALLGRIRMRDLDAATLETFERYYTDEARWTPDDLLIDVIDEDDGRLFAQRAGAERD